MPPAGPDCIRQAAAGAVGLAAQPPRTSVPAPGQPHTLLHDPHVAPCQMPHVSAPDPRLHLHSV